MTKTRVATVSEIMSEEVATVDAQISLRDAIDVLRDEGITGVPVVQGEEVVGVVSLTDILEFEATNPGVPTARPDTAWVEFDAPEEWDEGTENPPAYFIDYWSDAGAGATARFDEPDSPEWDYLEDHVVAEVMTRQVVKLSPDASIEETALLMTSRDVHRVLVMTDGVLQGVVTMTDIVRAVAEGKV